MSRRQLTIIFAVLAVLLGAFAGIRLLDRAGNGPGRGGEAIVSAVAEGFSLVRVLGAQGKDTVRLELSGDSWTVNGYPADTALVRQLAEGLDTALVGRLVARSAANHGRLGITADSARQVEIGPAGEPDLVFHLGRGGTDGRFIRFPPSDEVYTIPALSMRLFNRSEAEWRNRIVAVVDTATVGRIAVRRNDQPGPVLLSRAPGDTLAAWSLDGSAVDTAAVGDLLREAVTITATGFPTDSVAFAVDFTSPVAALEMFDSDEPGAAPSLSLLFLTAPDARDFLVRRADDPLSYRISAAQAERLLPTRARLLGSDSVRP
mgnify:CR=1 FL=1